MVTVSPENGVCNSGTQRISFTGLAGIVPELSMIAPHRLVIVPKFGMEPELVREAKLVMVPELVKKPEFKRVPKLVMMPELVMMERVEMPKPPVLEIVMVPALSIVPKTFSMPMPPVFDTIMVPALSMMPALRRPLLKVLEIVMVPALLRITPGLIIRVSPGFIVSEETVQVSTPFHVPPIAVQDGPSDIVPPTAKASGLDKNPINAKAKTSAIKYPFSKPD